MKKKVLIGICVAVVVVASVGGYLLSAWMRSSRSGRTINLEKTSQRVTDNTLQSSQLITFTSVTPQSVVNPSLFTKEALKLGAEFGDEYSPHIYKVGIVTSGMYKGDDVWLVRSLNDGPGYAPIYHFIMQGNKITLIAKNSSELYEGDSLNRSMFVIDTTSVLSSLIFPSKVSHNNLTFTLDIATDNNSNNSMRTFFDERYKPQDIVLAFTDPKLGKVYRDIPGPTDPGSIKQNGFYLKAPNGTLRAYSLDIGFYDKSKNMPSLTWNDGTANTAEYVITDIGGCGARNYASVTSGVSIDDLLEAGKTSTGDIIYQLKDTDHPILKAIYKNDYNPYNTDKLSYPDFVAARPAFFWFDSFGRLIKFQRADFIPQAECGKPVIYLYPQKTTSVSVKIDPQGGLTKSEPAYNDGWNVIATPESQLTEISTGNTYPYLFWEGRGGIYSTPKKGFVIPSYEVRSFLIEKLTKLGLNQKEQSDFIEFWEPRMTGSPYFFVTFLGNQAMDNIAPLTISPKPDSVIRILMDFTPLQVPISVEGYDIKTPMRKGFTVVEWGGVLR